MARASQPARRRRTQHGAIRGTLIIACLIGLAVASLPTVLVATLALLPALVAAVTDRTPGRYSAWTVGSANVAGLVPFLPPLWLQHDGMTAAVNVIGDVFTMAVIYGAAAVGWGVYFALPALVVAMGQIVDQRRIAQLRAAQKAIVDEWGEEVMRRSQVEKVEAAAE